MSTFGELLRVTTFGESHGAGVGAVIDGLPPQLPLSESDLQGQLDRRRPGQSAVTTTRAESDTVVILSGTERGLTLGTPVALLIRNHGAEGGNLRLD
jgi:chorismate synthase